MKGWIGWAVKLTSGDFAWSDTDDVFPACFARKREAVAWAVENGVPGRPVKVNITFTPE
jgi:hypothetical protein